MLDVSGARPAMWNALGDGTTDTLRRRSVVCGTGTTVAHAYANDRWTITLARASNSSEATFSAVCLPPSASGIAVSLAIDAAAPGRTATNQRVDVTLAFSVHAARGARELFAAYFLECGEGAPGAHPIVAYRTETEKAVVGSSMTALVPVPYYAALLSVSVDFLADWDGAASWSHAVTVTLARDFPVSALR